MRRTSVGTTKFVLFFHSLEVPTEVLRITVNLVWKLFERYVDPWLTKLDPVHEVLERESCLSGPGAPGKHYGVARHEAAAKHLVKFDDTGLDPKTFPGVV